MITYKTRCELEIEKYLYNLQHAWKSLCRLQIKGIQNFPNLVLDFTCKYAGEEVGSC